MREDAGIGSGVGRVSYPPAPKAQRGYKLPAGRRAGHPPHWWICLPLLCRPLLAAEPSIEVSPRKITVGDPIEVVLSMEVSEEGQVQFPLAGDFAPAEVLRSDTLDAQGSRRTIRYTITLFEPGEQELPELPIVTQSDGAQDTLRVALGAIDVASVVESEADSLKDIRPPVKLPWTFREMLPFIIGGLVGLGAAIAAFLWWKKRRREAGELPEYAPPPLPPDVVAMNKLEELRVKRLWQDGRIKEYHSELTEILKEYIGASYQFNALEMTTEELLWSRTKWTDDDNLFGQMRRILTLADLVKFAKMNPTPHDHEKSLELAFAYVETTRPKREALAA